MLVYGLDDAFEDVSLVALKSGEPLDWDLRCRAARLLHTLVCAGRVVGLPDDPEQWPTGHPGSWIVQTMRHAGPPQEVDAGPAEASPWALREAAAECETAWHLDRDNLDHLPDEERAREEEHRELVLQEIEGLRDQAEYIEVTHAELPGRDGLDEYDAELLARERQ